MVIPAFFYVQNQNPVPICVPWEQGAQGIGGVTVPGGVVNVALRGMI